MFLVVLPMLLKMLLHISCLGIWPKEHVFSYIEVRWLEEELEKKKSGFIF